MMKCKQKWIYW